jgi:hypothetical protein
LDGSGIPPEAKMNIAPPKTGSPVIGKGAELYGNGNDEFVYHLPS